MKGRFYPEITEQIILDYKEFQGNNEAIAIDDIDIRIGLKDCMCAALVVGKGAGKDRVEDAIKDGMDKLGEVAPGRSHNDVKMLIIKFGNNSAYPLMMDEFSTVYNLLEKQLPIEDYCWGIREHEDERDVVYTYMILGMS